MYWRVSFDLYISPKKKKERKKLETEAMEIETEMKQSRFRRICVFCGSSQGKKTSYQEAAIELGKELVLKEKKLYGLVCYTFFFFFG